MSTNNEHSFYTSDDEIDLRAVLRLLFQNYKLILGTAFSFAVVGALISLFILKPIYESTAVILSTRDQSLAGRFSSMFGNSSISQLLRFSGINQEVTQYYEILKSKTLANEVIETLDLIKLMEVEVDEGDPLGHEKAQYWLAEELGKKVQLSMEGDILRLSYRNQNPELAHQIVAAYLSKLRKFVQKNTATVARSTQEFIEERLNEVESQLKVAEEKYLALQNTKGVVELPSQLGLTLNTASHLRSQLIEKEMEIELYKNIMKDSSEIQRLESEKAQIQAQLSRLIQGNQKNKSNNKVEVFTPLSEGASLTFQFANAERDYLMYVKLSDILRQQLELARIETKKQEPSFQIIDPPIVPLLPVGPNKKLITILSFLFGLLVSCTIIIFASNAPNLPSRVFRIVKVDIRRKGRPAILDEATDEIEIESRL